MPSPQSCLLSQKPEQLKRAEENSVFFYHYNQHWAVSQLRDDTVYLYNSMQPKVIYQQLREQLICLYGGKRIRPVKEQKGSTNDCGCFTIAFTISLLYGDEMTQHNWLTRRKQCEQTSLRITTSLANDC